MQLHPVEKKQKIKKMCQLRPSFIYSLSPTEEWC